MIERVRGSTSHKWKFINKDDFLAKANNTSKLFLGLITSGEKKSEDR